MSGPKADAIIARSSDSSIKKRKKKPKNEDYTSKLEMGNGLLMRDEDEWNRGDDVDMTLNMDDESPSMSSFTSPLHMNSLLRQSRYTNWYVVVGKELATFNKSKSTWSTVGSTSLPMASQPAAAGPSSRPDEDVKPDIEVEAEEAPKKSLTKRKGGLKTALEIRAEADALKAEKETQALAAAEAAIQGDNNGEGVITQQNGNSNQGQTVHRDSSGRKVDLEKLKREAKALEDEERRKAREREEWSKGLVQRQRQQDRAREEAEMGSKDVARYVTSHKPAPSLRLDARNSVPEWSNGWY